MTTSLPDRPAFKRHLLAGTFEPDEVFVASEDRMWLWKNQGFGLLIPRLDGKHTISDLFDRLGSELSPPAIIYLLGQLNELGFLTEADDLASEGEASELAFWHALGVSTNAAFSGAATVRLQYTGSIGHELDLSRALADLGIRLTETDNANLEVIVADHYFRPELSEANVRNLARRSPWMVCKLVGRTLWIGPIFSPGHTGCLACLQDRLRGNRPVENYVVRKTADARFYETPAGSLSALSAFGATLTATEVVMWLSGRADRLEGKLIAVNFLPEGIDISTHTLVRRPQCSVCGSAGLARQPASIKLLHRTIAAGSDRIEPAETTLRRLQHHISSITGIVTSVAGVGSDPEGVVNNYSATHNIHLGPDKLRWVAQSLRCRTGGKGATPVQARAGAVCEAIERYCGTFRDDVYRIRNTYDGLSGQAVHPHSFLNISPRQYRDRERLNGEVGRSPFHLIPNPFRDDIEVDWVPLWSLSRREVRYLPAALCYHGHPDVGEHFYCTSDANGCAAGNVLEEAILYGLLELIERDSAAIWWYNRLPRPAIDLHRIADPYLEYVREYHERERRQIWALDITFDTGIPAIAAVSRRLDGASEDLLIGLGAHVDSSLALRRAIFELNQFLPAVSARKPNGDTRYSWPDSAAVAFWQSETLNTQPHLAPAPKAPHLAAHHISWARGVDLLDSVEACLHAVDRLGLEVMVLDQSCPDIELSVARVVVPGLRHFWPRFGPGRLYEVPVKLGLIGAPTAEDHLNPTPIFF